jgi:hypothetical protein
MHEPWTNESRQSVVNMLFNEGPTKYLILSPYAAACSKNVLNDL